MPNAKLYLLELCQLEKMLKAILLHFELCHLDNFQSIVCYLSVSLGMGGVKIMWFWAFCQLDKMLKDKLYLLELCQHEKMLKAIL